MRVLVLGGTRFIGAAAVRRLAALGHAITVFHRGQTEPRPALPDAVIHVHGERHELAARAEALTAPRPDVVLDMRPLNAHDAAVVMGAFRGRTGRIVAISSADVYRTFGCMLRLESAPPETGPVTEGSALRTVLRPYRAMASGPDDYRHDYDKIPAEAIFLGESSLPGTVLRLPMVYGPGDYQHRTHAVIKRVADGRPHILVPQSLAGWRGARSYVDDVGLAIALAVCDDRAAGRIYNVAEPEAPTELEWQQRVARACGFTGEFEVIPDDRLPDHLLPEFDTTHHLVLSSERIRAELDYGEVAPAGEAMAATVAWERIHPPPTLEAKDFDYAAEDHAHARWFAGKSGS